MSIVAIRRKGPSTIRHPAGGSLTGTALRAQQDFVTIDANGRTAIAVASGNNVGAATLLALANMTRAAADATGSDMGNEYFDDNMLVELTALNGANTKVATNVNMVGKQYELRFDATYGWCCDTGANTNKKLEVVGLAQTNKYPVGTVGGPLLCKVISTARLQ